MLPHFVTLFTNRGVYGIINIWDGSLSHFGRAVSRNPTPCIRAGAFGMTLLHQIASECTSGTLTSGTGAPASESGSRHDRRRAEYILRTLLQTQTRTSAAAVLRAAVCQ